MKNLQNLFIVTILVFIGCGTVEIKDDGSTDRKDDGRIARENNLYIYINDTDIVNTEDDRQCYYTIYINEVESGRTTTGLESQEKIFEAALTPDKHLVKVEKWVLNENLGRYVKVNNIDQPKPDYIYVDIKKNDIIRVRLKSSKTGTATYNIDVE
ncbi:MAG: hypothetical protein FWH53_03900 [Leptospirales bacterium]|nr:hypothetical protein [Leptospirales bacterium]